MALVFLVILYASPSGLVLYWTMNNVFSLVKNIFYKIKNPKKVLYILLVAAVAGLDAYLIFIHHGFMHKRLLLAVAVSLLLLAPLAIRCVSYLLDTVLQPLTESPKTRLLLFIPSCLALCLFAGLVVPSLRFAKFSCQAYLQVKLFRS